MTIQKIDLIHAIADIINLEDKSSAIKPEVRENMTISLAEFVEAAIVKFAKGQAEHGGDIRQRDLGLEVRNEQLDIFWYIEADKRWPKLKED